MADSEPDEVTADEPYKLYLEDRKMLIKAWSEGSKTFDKAMLTFASGAFTVSIAFLKDVAPNPHPNTLWLLGCSWLLFSVSLIVILCSFVASQKACKAQIDITYSELMKKEKHNNTWTTITSIFNFASLAALILAFGFAGGFIYWNKIYTP